MLLLRAVPSHPKLLLTAQEQLACLSLDTMHQVLPRAFQCWDSILTILLDAYNIAGLRRGTFLMNLIAAAVVARLVDYKDGPFFVSWLSYSQDTIGFSYLQVTIIYPLQHEGYSAYSSKAHQECAQARCHPVCWVNK